MSMGFGFRVGRSVKAWAWMIPFSLGLGLTPGCSSSSDPASPAGSSGTNCDAGLKAPSGACITVGVPADQCGAGFTPDGKKGCLPILPDADCPDGTMPMLGKTECQAVGVPADKCAAGFEADGHAGCKPILPTAECPEGTMAVLGNTTCQPVGVPSDQCGAGFTSDSQGGCEPVLPATECPQGQMAVPGETSCHEPQSCGTGTWGDIPTTASTQFVDASYSGGGSDGSVSKPWTTIGEAISHASAGGQVAVAAGTYVENLTLAQGVTIWGVCPSKVSVIGATTELPTVTIQALPSGQSVEVRGLGVSGPAEGVYVLGAVGVTLTNLWVHDTGGDSRGVYLAHQGVPASVLVQGSLIEDTHRQGILVNGSDATVQNTVIRGTLGKVSDGTLGTAIRVDRANGHAGALTLKTSLLERNHTAGLIVLASQATVENTVVRDTLPQTSDSLFGIGTLATADSGFRGNLTIRTSLFDRNHDYGVYLSGSDATIENTVIRGTMAQESDMEFGRGVEVEFDVASAERSTVSLSSSLIDSNTEVGVFVNGSDATIQSSIIRDTQPKTKDASAGSGVLVQSDGTARGKLILNDSILARNRSFGVIALSGDAEVRGSMIRDTLPQASDSLLGGGIQAQEVGGNRSNLTVSSCVLDGNTDAGLAVFGSDSSVDGTLVTHTKANAFSKKTGRGIVAEGSGGELAKMTLTASVIDQNREIGLYVEGADVTVENTVVRGTRARELDDTGGRGIEVDGRPGIRPSLTLSASLVDGNTDVGLYVSGADVTVSGTIIRDTQARVSDQKAGEGIQVEDHEGASAALTLTASLLDQNHEAGIAILGSDATIQDCVVRNTLQQVSKKILGRGVATQANGGFRGRLTLASTLVDHSFSSGMFVGGSDVTVENSVIRNTLAQESDKRGGYGVVVQTSPDSTERGAMTMTSSTIENNTGVGLLLLGSDATVHATTIETTQAGQEKSSIGDGVCAVLSMLTMSTSLLQDNARASMSNFGSQVTIDQVGALCSPIYFDEEVRAYDLTGQPIDGVSANFSTTQTACAACDGEPLACTAVSQNLESPDALDSIEPAKPSL